MSSGCGLVISRVEKNERSDCSGVDLNSRVKTQINELKRSEVSEVEESEVK